MKPAAHSQISVHQTIRISRSFRFWRSHRSRSDPRSTVFESALLRGSGTETFRDTSLLARTRASGDLCFSDFPGDIRSTEDVEHNRSVEHTVVPVVVWGIGCEEINEELRDLTWEASRM